MLLIFTNIQLSVGASARKQLFCKLRLCVGLCGLQMCCFVRGLFIISYSFFLSFSSKLSVHFGLLHLAVTSGCMWSAGAFLPVTKVSGQTRLAGENETSNMLWSPGCRIQPCYGA